MTEEEINKKAEKHCNEVLCNEHEKCYEVIKCRDWRSRRAGYFCGYEQALKDFEKENAELKADNDARKFAMAMSEKVEKQLREENAELIIENEKLKKENAELKETNNNLVASSKTIISLSNEIEDRTMKQLTNAKEIINTFLGFAEAFGYSPSMDNFISQAKQFLKGESTAEQPNECHDCAKFDEMPKGPRCKTCDNGSHFQKKEEA